MNIDIYNKVSLEFKNKIINMRWYLYILFVSFNFKYILIVENYFYILKEYKCNLKYNFISDFYYEI